jgi:DinB superfamily
MYTKDAIRYSLNMADQATMRSLATIEDVPLTFPTENGGCHPLWVMGHLAFVEGLTHEMLGGGGNPVAHWAEIFGPDTVPMADAAQYPAFAKVRDKYVQLRNRNLQLLESMTEADLDRPTASQPKGLEEHFATFGKALLTVALHQMAHRGHITDAFRAAGRVTPVLAGVGA